MQVNSKIFITTLATGLSLTACATTKTNPAIPAQAVILQQSQIAAANKETKQTPNDFNCETLYSNYSTAMSQFKEASVPKKKGSFLRNLGQAALNNSGALASMTGVGLIASTQIQTVGKIASRATGHNPNDPSQMIAVMGTASSAIEVQRTSNKLALENGCDISRLNPDTP